MPGDGFGGLPDFAARTDPGTLLADGRRQGIEGFRPAIPARLCLCCLVLVLTGILLLGATCYSKKKNPNYVPNAEDARYPEGQGPAVCWHSNGGEFSPTGGFAPLSALLESDGYVVETFSLPFDAFDLSGCRIVIRIVPQVAATESEIIAFWNYVVLGGSAFLVTDHPPHPLQMNDLTSYIGVILLNQSVIHDGSNCSPNLCPSANISNNYTVHPETLGEHLVNSGIEYVQTYDGSAIEDWPVDAVSVLGLGDDALRGDTMESISGASRGVCGVYGLGRYCILSEALTITSKCAPAGCSTRVMGFDGHANGTPNAEYNEQFTLQVIRWLDDGTITNGSG